MNCPIDNTVLSMSNRNGVEIDYCPSCRGVWLDRGELDKIIERDTSGQNTREHYNSNTQNHHTSQQPHKKKRESFLGDLFDF